MGPYVKNVLKIFSSETQLSHLGPTFGGMVHRWSPFRNMSDDPTRQPKWPTSADIILTLDQMGKMFLKSSPLKLLGLLGVGDISFKVWRINNGNHGNAILVCKYQQ